VKKLQPEASRLSKSAGSSTDSKRKSLRRSQKIKKQKRKTFTNSRKKKSGLLQNRFLQEKFLDQQEKLPATGNAKKTLSSGKGTNLQNAATAQLS